VAGYVRRVIGVDAADGEALDVLLVIGVPAMPERAADALQVKVQQAAVEQTQRLFSLQRASSIAQVCVEVNTCGPLFATRTQQNRPDRRIGAAARKGR